MVDDAIDPGGFADEVSEFVNDDADFALGEGIVKSGANVNLVVTQAIDFTIELMELVEATREGVSSGSAAAVLTRSGIDDKDARAAYSCGGPGQTVVPRQHGCAHQAINLPYLFHSVGRVSLVVDVEMAIEEPQLWRAREDTAANIPIPIQIQKDLCGKDVRNGRVDGLIGLADEAVEAGEADRIDGGFQKKFIDLVNSGGVGLDDAVGEAVAFPELDVLEVLDGGLGEVSANAVSDEQVFLRAAFFGRDVVERVLDLADIVLPVEATLADRAMDDDLSFPRLGQ